MFNELSTILVFTHFCFHINYTSSLTMCIIRCSWSFKYIYLVTTSFIKLLTSLWYLLLLLFLFSFFFITSLFLILLYCSFHLNPPLEFWPFYKDFINFLSQFLFYAITVLLYAQKWDSCSCTPILHLAMFSQFSIPSISPLSSFV